MGTFSFVGLITGAGASLLLLVVMAQSVNALSISHVSSRSARRGCSSFIPRHNTRILRSIVPRARATQLAAAEDGEPAGDFFSDGSSSSNSSAEGGFFDDAEKPPAPQKENEPPMTLEELEMLATPYDEHLPKINTVTLVGRVGNAPEPKYFDDGKVVLNLSLAVKRKYHPLERKVRDIRSGDEETDWFALELWGRDAEYVTNYVEKGARMGITGSLVQDGWTDKMTGEQRRKAKIIVRHVDILESRAEAELRKSNKGGNYQGGGSGGSGGGGGGRNNYGGDDDEGPSPAGTGGFFS